MNLKQKILKENLEELNNTYLEQSANRLEKIDQQLSLVSNAEERARLEELFQLERKKALLEHKASLKLVFSNSLNNDPGQSLLNILEYFVSEKNLENTFFPLVADWQEEYFNAQDEKRGRFKLACIHIRHSWAFAQACGLMAVLRLFCVAFIKFTGK